MKPILENYWFTSSGRGKRVSAARKHLRSLAHANKSLLVPVDMIGLTKLFRFSKGLDLADALCCAVAFVGLYSNPSKSILFKPERYTRGCELLGIPNFTVTVGEQTFSFTSVETATIFFNAFEAFCKLRKIRMTLQTNFSLDDRDERN